MKLLDRHKLATLMVIRNVSNRQLAKIAGWKAHSYVARLLDGSATTLKTDPALRIAEYFGVPVNDLFVTRLSTDTAHTAKQRRAA